MVRSKRLTLDEKLESLEAQLAGTLKPIQPPRDFVRRLRGRIRMPQRGELVNRLSNWRRLFFVFSGVISGMLVLITVGRALYYLAVRKSG